MVSLRQRLYWKAPYFIRCWMASQYGRATDRARRGEAYWKAVETIAQHDRWTEGQILDYQRRELRRMLDHVAAHVPYYRRVFAERGLDVAKIRGPEDLPQLPILEKEIARANPAELVDQRRDPGRLMISQTSGTTGTPLILYHDVEQHSCYYGYMDARWHSVAGVCRGKNRSVSLGGHAVAPPGATRPPFWVHNRHWNQLYMSSYHLSERYLDRYVAAIRQFAPEFIEGYPSSLYAVARHMADRHEPPIVMKAAFTTAEMLFDYQREAIAGAFGCKTYSQYGAGEYCVFAAECERGTMHISPEIGVIEVVDEKDRPLGPGQTGALVCTSLINYVQGFIRYRLGDAGSLGQGSCKCGRPLPILSALAGRTDDVLITKDGRRLGLAHMSLAFYGIRGVREAQFIQEGPNQYTIRVAAGPDYRDADGEALVKAFLQRVGEDAAVKLERVAGIERTRIGKYRMIVSRLPGNPPPRTCD